jgi:molecular chaperone DnaK
MATEMEKRSVGYGVGIDVGSSSVAVAVREDGAARMLALEGSETHRIAGGGPGLSATLRSVLRAVGAVMGADPDTVVLTYPAGEGRYGRDQMHKAARLAGLDGVSLISDAQAATAHYATRERLSEGDVVAVYDLSDDDFSTTVTKLTSTGVTILGPPDGVEGVGRTALDRAPLELTLAALHHALDSAGVAAADLAGVLVLSGSAPIPLIPGLLSSSLGRPVQVDPESADCAALGAALLSGVASPEVLAANSAAFRAATTSVPSPAGPHHRHRRIAAIAAVTAVLIGGGAYLALEPGSPISPRSPAPAALGPQSASNPTPTGPTGGTAKTGGSSTVSQVVDTGTGTGPTAGPTVSLPPGSTAVPSGTAGAPATAGSSATAGPPGNADPSGTAGPTAAPTDPGASATPAPSDSSSPAAPAGLVVRVGTLCYDVADPNRQGEFPIVPC